MRGLILCRHLFPLTFNLIREDPSKGSTYIGLCGSKWYDEPFRSEMRYRFRPFSSQRVYGFCILVSNYNSWKKPLVSSYYSSLEKCVNNVRTEFEALVKYLREPSSSWVWNRRRIRKSDLSQNFQRVPSPTPGEYGTLARQSTGWGEVNIKNVVSGLLLVSKNGLNSKSVCGQTISLGKLWPISRRIRITCQLRCSIYSHFPSTLNLTAEKMSQSCITSVLFSL